MSAAEVAVLAAAGSAKEAATEAAESGGSLEEREADAGTPVPGWPEDHMLEAAMCLLTNAGEAPHDPAGWNQAKQRWMDAYHRWLAAHCTPARLRGAVIEIVERVATAEDLAALDDPNNIGLIVPNEIRLNGTPLLITEDGPRIEGIDCAEDGKPGLVKVTMTVLARRVSIHAEGPAE